MSAATSDEWSLEAVGQGFKGWVEEVGERVGLDGSETIVLKQSPDDDDGRAKIIDEKNDSSGGATSTTAASETEQPAISKMRRRIPGSSIWSLPAPWKRHHKTTTIVVYETLHPLSIIVLIHKQKHSEHHSK